MRGEKHNFRKNGSEIFVMEEVDGEKRMKWLGEIVFWRDEFLGEMRPDRPICLGSCRSAEHFVCTNNVGKEHVPHSLNHGRVGRPRRGRTDTL
jgi:hypothetical protein